MGGLSRREFLVDSAKAALSAGLGASLLGASGCGGASSSSGISPRAWKDLASKISGQVLLPGDPGFKASALPNNLRYASRMPAGIAKCLNVEDVAQSILWSRRNDVHLIARSGGHSYAGYSTTRGLMIDLTQINQAQYDPSTGIVTLGGGIRNTDVYTALHLANATITHGRCPTVGAAAFVLGGGIGFNMRRFGLACDHLVETELVTATGDILTVSATENPDLFWACAGVGGGNLGIDTSMQLQTFPVSDLTVFKLTWTADPENLYAALIPALQAGPSTLALAWR
jgi:FAD/FMN-containing dehydrogenase